METGETGKRRQQNPEIGLIYYCKLKPMFSSFYPLVFPPYDKFKFIENLKTFRSSLLFNQSSFYWQKAFRFLVKSQHLYIVQSPLPSNYCLNFLMQNVVKCAGCRLWCEGPGKTELRTY